MCLLPKERKTCVEYTGRRHRQVFFPRARTRKFSAARRYGICARRLIVPLAAEILRMQEQGELATAWRV